MVTRTVRSTITVIFITTNKAILSWIALDDLRLMEGLMLVLRFSLPRLTFPLSFSNFPLRCSPMLYFFAMSTLPNVAGHNDVSLTNGNGRRDAVLLQLDLGERDYLNALNVCLSGSPDRHDVYCVHEKWARKQVSLLVRFRKG